MGFLDHLKASQAQQNADWKILTDISQLENISNDSKARPIILFKHSTSCGISAGAKHRLEMKWYELESEFDFYYLDLLSHRDVSNAISEKWNVRHESPQVIVIRNDENVFHASHGRINANTIAQYL